jgi:hypothetical protein
VELVERDELLAELSDLLGDPRAGSGRIVFVGGEAGVGKTSLVRAFCADLPGSVRVLWGACDPLTTPTALGPFHDMALAEPTIAAVLERSDRRALLTGLLDELALTTAMVVDDAHWADEATLDSLRFLGRRVQMTRGLVLVTFRDDELGADHPLRVLVGDLATATGARRLDVAPLSLAGVKALATGHDIDAADLHHATAGNPFYVTEVLAGSGTAIPPTVSDAVRARTTRLTPVARRMLDMFAVSPGGLEPEVASSLVEETTGLDECVEHGMLMPEGDRHAFRHELARRALEAAIPTGRRRQLNLELLSHLESRAGIDPARLAHHADAAGDRAAVLRHAPEAARYAGARGAHREEAQHYWSAIAQLADLPPLERAELLAACARAEFSFDFSCIPELLVEEIGIRHAEADAHGEAAAHGLLGVVRRMEGEIDAGRTELLRAAALLEELPVGPELALTYARLAHKCSRADARARRQARAHPPSRRHPSRTRTAHPPPARSPDPARRRPQQRRHRPRALHHGEDRRAPRLGGPPQARSAHPY